MWRLNINFFLVFFFFKQKTAYEIVSRDWSSDVCSSDLLKCILLSTLWQLYLYHQKYFHFRHKIVWKWHCLICWLVQTSAVCSKTKDGFSLKNVIFFLKRLWPIYTDQWKVHSLVVWTSMMFEFVCACVWPSVFGCACNESYKWDNFSDNFSHWCNTKPWWQFSSHYQRVHNSLHALNILLNQYGL